MLLGRLEAPEVHLKRFYDSIKDSVTLYSISRALLISNDILRKKSWNIKFRSLGVALYSPWCMSVHLQGEGFI